MLSSLRIHELKTSHDLIFSDFFHLFDNLSLEVIMFVGVRRIEVPLEVAITEFVCRFVLPITVPLLLNCIVGEVDHLIRKILNVIFL